MIATRRIETMAVATWLQVVLFVGCGGCAAELTPQKPESLWTVIAPEGNDRVVLVSEAESDISAGRSLKTCFRLAPRDGRPATLELMGLGCSCYSLRRGDSELQIGDTLWIPANDVADLQIESTPSTLPGIKEFWAEFSGTNSEDKRCSQFLTCRVQTVMDLAVRPEVVNVSLGDRSAGRSKVVPLQIEQHARHVTAEPLQVRWHSMPEGIAITQPGLEGSPVEIQPGLWRCRWKCELHVTSTHVLEGQSPFRLPLASLLNGRQVAETSCLLNGRRASGVQAPPLVHLGRLSPGVSAKRRVQLRALDGREFAILSAESRDGHVEAAVSDPTVAIEHWLEIRASATRDGVDDELLIQTDHPETPELRFPVRAIGPG